LQMAVLPFCYNKSFIESMPISLTNAIIVCDVEMWGASAINGQNNCKNVPSTLMVQSINGSVQVSYSIPSLSASGSYSIQACQQLDF